MREKGKEGSYSTYVFNRFSFHWLRAISPGTSQAIGDEFTIKFYIDTTPKLKSKSKAKN